MSGDVAAINEVSISYGLKSANSTVPSGYKQTEVGLIPQDWSVVTIGDLNPFVTSGSRGWARYYSKYGSLFIRITNMDRKRIRLDLSDVRYVRIPETEHEGTRTSVTIGDVLISITADIGIISYVDDLISLPAYINQHVALARFDDESVLPKYVALFLAFGNGQKRFKQITDQGAKAGINLKTVRDLPIAIPPTLKEQSAIATALSDIDALLEELDRLIAKKRDIKQATMQQLLTGQTRLPGFEGEWEIVRLGDHANFLRNGTNSRAELASNGSVKYLHYGDIHACRSATLKPDNLPYLPDHKTKSLDKLQTGDLIFADASEDMEGVGKSVEIVDLDEGKVVSGLHTIAVRFSKSVLADGFKAYLQNCPRFINQLRRLAAGTKVYATVVVKCFWPLSFEHSSSSFLPHSAAVHRYACAA